VEDIRELALDHRIRFDECDASGLVRPSGYLRAMQDLAWQHSERLGFGRQWYLTNRLAWLVRFADLHVVGEARSGDTLRVTTRVTGWRRVWARRESTASVDGAGVAWAVIDWVLIDAAGRPARVPPGIAEMFTDGIPTFQPGRLALPDAPADAVVSAWPVGIRDLDPMAHVNNATYLDVLDEAIGADTGSLTGPQPPVRYELEYLRPALPRVQVSVIRWVTSGQTVAVFRVDDDELMRARLTLG
jgi:medium-chain acyl-[acyl-carrier-protein] hydrolase